MKKQNLLKLSLIVSILSLAVMRPASTFAATTNVTGGTNGPLCNSGGYFTPSSVTVTSGDTITFSVPANDPYAGGVQINGFPQGGFVVPRGGSVTTQALTADVSYQGTWPNSPSCIKGSGSITVQTAAGSGSGSTSGTSSGGSTSSGTTSSGASSSTSTPPTSSTKSTPKSTSSASTTAPATAQSSATPETVVANTILVGGAKVTSIQDLTIKPSQTLELSGTTVPNGKITLTIHSNPIIAAVQADANGNWSYTLTGLQPGNHTVYATVTDPNTNQTSASSKLLAFTVSSTPAAKITNTPTNTTKQASPKLLYVSIGVIVVLLLATAVLFILKKKKNGNIGITTIAPTAPTQETPQSTPTVVAPQDGSQAPSPLNDDQNHGSQGTNA